MSNSASDLGSILDQTAQIESLMDQVIESFCRPRDGAYRFFVQVLLHGSSIPLGTKAKLITAIAQEVNFSINKDGIHKLISLRNAFAHHTLDSHPTFRYGADESLRYELAIITSNGSVKRTDRSVAKAEFDDLFLPIRHSIYELRDAVDAAVQIELGKKNG